MQKVKFLPIISNNMFKIRTYILKNYIFLKNSNRKSYPTNKKLILYENNYLLFLPVFLIYQFLRIKIRYYIFDVIFYVDDLRNILESYIAIILLIYLPIDLCRMQNLLSGLSPKFRTSSNPKGTVY